MGYKNRPDGKDLYFYSSKDLSRFFKDIGRSNFWENGGIDIKRNSDGTALSFLSDPIKKVIIVSIDGSIKEMDIPGYPAWFDDNHQIVAWHDRNEGMVHYKNEMSEKISMAFRPCSGPDPSGRYFIKSPTPSRYVPISVSCSTEIYAIERPTFPLAKVGVCGIQKIYFKNDKVLLFGRDYCGKDDKIKDLITAHIFQMRDGKLTEIEKVDIPPPSSPPILFSVMDLCPWDNEVLFVDSYDLPHRDRLYRFNLKTHEMKKIGYVPFSGGWGFYLQCDILKKVTKKFRDGKGK